MGRADRAGAKVEAHLQDGESLRHVDFSHVKPPEAHGGDAKRMAKDVAISMAASTALSAVSPFGVLRTTRPVLLWVALTSDRLLMFKKEDSVTKPVGDLVFETSRHGLRTEAKDGLRGEFHLYSQDGGDDPIALLSFGLRKGASKKMAEAIDGG